jgi:hypothetical protein
LRGELMRHQKISPHLLIAADQLVNDPDYLTLLRSQNPGFPIPLPSSRSDKPLPPIAIIHFLDLLAASHEIYYLHSSFGFFFERYQEEPEGLIYHLKAYPTNVWEMPVASKERIAKNQDFWKKTHDDILPPLLAVLNTPAFPAQVTLWNRLIDAAHLKMEQDWAALPLGGYYARELNYWGVELQRVKMLDEAGTCFTQAEELNPANISVRVNETYNKNTREGKQRTLQLPKELQERLNQPSFWGDVLNVDGPMDEPNFRGNLALVLANAGE